MAGIGESLTHKLGPLPVWAWGGIAVAGVLVFGKRAGGGGGGAPSAASQSQYPGGSLPQTVASAPMGNDPISQQYLQHIDQGLQDLLAQHQTTTQQLVTNQHPMLPSATPSAGLSSALQGVLGVISNPSAPYGNPRYTAYNQQTAQDLAGHLASTGLDDTTLSNIGNFIISHSYPLRQRDLDNINALKAQGFTGDDLTKRVWFAMDTAASQRLQPRYATPYVANQGWFNGFSSGTAGI